jgi:glycosyltransferase involved in cell wall biosynthesis
MVSTRFSGLDGVSLESAKIAEVLRAAGHETVWFGGALDAGFQPGLEYPPAHFDAAENSAIQAACFGASSTSEETRRRIKEEAGALEAALERFIDEFAVDALMVQNALAIPMHLPLAVALTAVLESSRLTAVAHHHDFSWERQRFAECGVPDLLEALFPPRLPNLQHIVINQDAADELKARTGLSATVLPNVMDFGTEPEPGDGVGYRNDAGVTDETIVLLQPTRVIPRKGIEMTIELASRLTPRLDRPISILVSHDDDLHAGYWSSLRQLAEELKVDLRLASVGNRSTHLGDAYAAADLVCFPSLYEGFGNALLEAFYYRRPVFVNRYSVYVRDIAPLGVKCAEADGEVTDTVVTDALHILSDLVASAAMTDWNFEVGRRHLSYDVIEKRILPLF